MGHRYLLRCIGYHRVGECFRPILCCGCLGDRASLQLEGRQLSSAAAHPWLKRFLWYMNTWPGAVQDRDLLRKSLGCIRCGLVKRGTLIDYLFVAPITPWRRLSLFALFFVVVLPFLLNFSASKECPPVVLAPVVLISMSSDFFLSSNS